jgi:hypothetical protein
MGREAWPYEKAKQGTDPFPNGKIGKTFGWFYDFGSSPWNAGISDS